MAVDYAKYSEVLYHDDQQTVTLSVVGNRLIGRLWAVSPGKPFLVWLPKGASIDLILNSRLDEGVALYHPGKHPFHA